jgi:hypothetical protein
LLIFDEVRGEVVEIVIGGLWFLRRFMHDIVPYEFVLYEGWILKRALFCGMPRIRVLVFAKKTFVVLVQGGRRREVLMV